LNGAAGRRDLLVGTLAIGGGLMVVWLAMQIRGMPGQPFSPGFAPSIIGGAAALVGAVLVLRAALGQAPALEEEEAGSGPPFRAAALWVGGGILAIAVLFETVGFVPLLVVWLTGFLLLTGVRLLPAIAFAMPMVLGMDLAFTTLLGVPLPPGDWMIALGLLD
jgi:putative tricarboxylic transport membrane protein